MIEDRFTRGLLAGMIAKAPTFSINSIFMYFGISDLMFKDFMAIMIFGRKAANVWEEIFAYGATLGHFAVLGGIFSILLLVIGVRNPILKGAFYGGSLWFVFYSITSLFKVPELTSSSLGTTFGNFTGSLVWGVSVALAFVWLDKKVVPSHSLKPLPEKTELIEEDVTVIYVERPSWWQRFRNKGKKA